MEWPRPWYSNLWAPWRMAYIREHGRRESCVFCEAPRQGVSAESLVVYKGAKSYVILNKYPYNSGHLMVVPYRHVSEFEDLTLEEMGEMMLLVRASVRALRRAYRPHGFNIGMNLGEAAGAGIAGHLHIHIVPRWVGDTNYTTILAGVKVLPQSLEEAWKTLKPLVEEEVKREARKG